MRQSPILLAIFLCAGCVARATHFNMGVELAPDSSGWKDDLRIEPESIPVQFRWASGSTVIEIANWPHDPTYFMVYVRNESEEPAGIRVHGLSPGFAAHGRYDAFASGAYVHGGTIADGAWIEVPARGMVQFWIDELPWLDAPSPGDRIDSTVDIRRGNDIVECPLKFHVARVLRSHR